MRSRSFTLAAPLLVIAWIAGCGGESASTSTSSSSSSSSSGSGGTGGDVTPFYSPPPPSCAYDCPDLSKCKETTEPYACPSLGAWDAIPHAETCPAWDGKYPAVTQGKCKATDPTGDALKRSGADPGDPTTFILPDARRIHPAGKEWVFNDVPGGLTSQVMDVPGTPFVIAVETGYGDHAVRCIDTTKLAAGQDPVVSLVTFPAPETLNWGLAFVAPGRVLVSSHDGKIHVFSLDLATGALAEDDAASIALPPGKGGGVYASGLAVSPDGSRLVITSADDPALTVISLAADATYGTEIGSVAIGQETFGAWFDPHDPSGNTVYVSMWSDRKVKAVDLSNAAAPVVKATYDTDKNPEGIAFLDARFLAVATANGDSVGIVDRATGEVTSVPIDADPATLHGQEPAIPAYDEAAKRLYVALGGDNAIAAFDVDLASAPPKLTRAGALGTGWWPSGVAVRQDGSLVVTTLRGHGGGPIPQPFGFGDSDIGLRMRGSVAFIPAPGAAELAAGDTELAIDNAPSALAGAPEIDCPSGADDFPIPATNEGGAKIIDHVFFILRENKNFDALLGDLAGVDGEPTYTLKQGSGDMDAIWHNFRSAARAFTVSDDYYTDAVFSTQGHVLAVYGRSSDFNERTWAVSGSRDGSPRAVPGGGVTPVGMPVEGSLFDWLYRYDVPFDILGEIDGAPTTPPGKQPALDIHYPGVGQAITLIDLPKACYASGRVRVACNIGHFVYQTLPNDHTVGLSADNPSPETMCAVNDEATGTMLDAISHSPYWKSSIVIITEDDPSSGGEHVDGHRTPLVVVSPWVKRGYVSKTHIDMASIHKLYAHIFGIPYPNRQVARAALPLDMFTSTPDFTPFSLEHRTWPLACGMGVQADKKPEKKRVPDAEEELTRSWDFSHEDEQPGLGEQVWRAMRGRPITELTPAMKARMLRWKRADRDGDRD